MSEGQGGSWGASLIKKSHKKKKYLSASTIIFSVFNTSQEKKKVFLDGPKRYQLPAVRRTQPIAKLTSTIQVPFPR